MGSQADKNVGLGCIANTIVELSHIARATWQFTNQFTKPLEAAALLRNSHRKQCLAFLADLGPLGDESQAIKIHIRPAQDGGIGFAFGLVGGDVLLDGGHRQSACRFYDAAGVHKNILDGRAHRVGIHRHKFIDQATGHAKGFFSDQFDRSAIRKQADI